MGILVAIAIAVLVAGIIVAAIAFLSNDEEMRTNAFKKEIDQVCSKGKRHLLKQRQDSIKGHVIVRLALLNSQRITGRKRLELCERRSGTLFDTQQALLEVYQAAMDKLRPLKLPEPEKLKRRREIEAGIKQMLADI